MIDFDPTSRPATPAEWQALVEAVFTADPEDESEWLEWKSSIDWAAKEHLGSVVAKAILGMANRVEPPSQLGGSGLIVFGLQPGNAEGVERIDPASLEEKIRPFLGQVRLPFEPRWHPFKGVDVLSIEVPPLPPGSTIFTLHRQSGKYADGTIFVRGPGQTKPATAVQVEALVARARVVEEKSIDIKLTPEPGATFPRYVIDPEVVEAYIEWRKKRLLTPMQEDSGRNGIFGTITNETRSREAYTAEVEAYIEKLRLRMTDALLDFGASIIPPVRLRLSNRTGTNYPGMHITLFVGGGVVGRDREYDIDSLDEFLPEEPERWSSSILGGLLPAYHPGQAQVPPAPSRREIENGERLVVRLAEVDLRAGDQDQLVERDLVLLVPVDYEGPAHVTWEATADGMDTIARGEFWVPGGGQPIDLMRRAIALDNEA